MQTFQMTAKLKITAIALAGLALAYGATVEVAKSDFACGSCHTDQHRSWKVSSHKNVNCRDCHVEPGIAGALKGQAQGVRDLLVALTRGTHITPHEDPLPISTQNCRDCHGAILFVNELGYEDLPENSLKGQGLVIGHRAHIEKYGMECVECHRGVVHRDPDAVGKYKTNWPLMKKDCGRCHDGTFSRRFQLTVSSVDNRKNCTVCHPYYVAPPDEQIE